MRIAMVSYYLPSESRMGVGHQVHLLANTMVTRGHEVTVFSGCGPTRGALYETVKEPLTGSARTFRFAWRLGQRDWSAFDVLHAHGDDNWISPLAVPRVRTLHGSCFQEARHIGSTKGVMRMGLLGCGEIISSLTAHEVVAVSENTYRRIPWIRAVIGNGVDPTRFAPGPKAERATILFVGTWNWRKRGSMLARIFSEQVRPALPGARLWMVAPDAPTVNTAGVEYLGRLSDEELAERMSAAWCFCLPSTYEGFGIPYVEAMMSGTAVISTPNPGFCEVTENGRVGVLSTDERLGLDLVDLLGDHARRRRFADLGLAASQRYRIGAVADAYETLYCKVTAGRLSPLPHRSRSAT